MRVACDKTCCGAVWQAQLVSVFLDWFSLPPPTVSRIAVGSEVFGNTIGFSLYQVRYGLLAAVVSLESFLAGLTPSPLNECC